jgi:hypothetical protein
MGFRIPGLGLAVLAMVVWAFGDGCEGMRREGLWFKGGWAQFEAGR